MECITPDGVAIWWEAEGSGSPVVLSPGRGDCSDVFPREFSEQLVEVGCRVVRFDPRDSGLSGNGGDAYTVSTMAEDVVGVLDAAGIEEAHFLGLSLSGLVLVDLAMRFPARVASLCFLSAMSPDPEAGFGEQLFAEPLADPVEALLAGMNSPSDADRRWVAEQHHRSLRRAPLRPEAGDRHNAAAFRFGWPQLGDLALIDRPTLVLHGQADRSLPVAHAHALANGLRNAALSVHPGMGHLPSRDQWQWAADQLVAHVRSRP